MSIQLDLDVIDAFRAVARHVANTAYHIDVPGNYFRVDALNANLPAYEIDEDLRCFCPGTVATIVFADIQPVRVLSIDVGAPIKFNEEEIDLSLQTYNNANSEPLPRKLKTTEEDIITESRDIITEISSAIRAKVGGKTPVFEASLEAEIAAKLGLNLKTQRQHRILKEDEMNITVPAWTSTSVTQKQSIADVRQVISMNCQVDAQVSLLSNGPGAVPWSKHFESLHELEGYLRGGGGGRDENADAINRFVNGRLFKDFTVPIEELELAVSRDRISRNVRTGEISVVSTPIENPNRRRGRGHKRRNRKNKEQ